MKTEKNKPPKNIIINLNRIIFIILLIFLNACNVSRMTVGLSNDFGDLQQWQNIDEEPTESGKGIVFEYRFQKMVENQGFGLSTSLHLNGYRPDGEGANSMSLVSLTPQYYRYLYKSDMFKLAGYTGMGPSMYIEFPYGSEFVGTANVGLDLYLLEDELVLFSIKNQYYRFMEPTDLGKNNFSVQISLGFRFIE